MVRHAGESTMNNHYYKKVARFARKKIKIKIKKVEKKVAIEWKHESPTLSYPPLLYWYLGSLSCSEKK
jgi:hypothetical protein